MRLNDGAVILRLRTAFPAEKEVLLLQQDSLSEKQCAVIKTGWRNVFSSRCPLDPPLKITGGTGMTNGLMEMEKKAFRREFAARRKAISPDERQRFDAAICENICNMEIFRNAENIAAFIPFGAEPDLTRIFRGKRLFLPRFAAHSGVYEMVAVEDLKRDLLPGKYGIPEPLPSLPAADMEFLSSQVLFLVPAVACDRNGCRLGRGGGYYDRLLAGVKTPPVAVIYSCQLSETALPGAEHDTPVRWVVTEREVVDIAGN
jgi:5-formyltetrahydrofolate cyclo-ligase